MPKPNAARAQRVRIHSRFLAATIPAMSAAGLLAGAATPAEAMVRHHAAFYMGPKGLVRFQSVLGVAPALRDFPQLRTAHASRVRRLLSRMVRAGDRIATLPYVYGGGHGSFAAAGYDCSGSVSYVLHAAGFLGTPEDSGSLESFGDPGPGRHVTIYANGGHALMTIDGRRFDTIALQESGNRWSSSIGDTSGYVVRHPHGL